ncbi:hypothetical protein AtNW77_Chr2g0259831 [Arabidopsis thaliana]|uniref:Uncharacterized protein n=1 Tax=Arabidopsis thaliana x Arabidopsis arenosa TaxID=1240361 RepID=A0A8T2FRQ1_9BRAS|nr:hypothetical protein ISN45_At02g033230 [Arabidopsis thaliana x Arabidopsis arenosa]
MSRYRLREHAWCLRQLNVSNKSFLKRSFLVGLGYTPPIRYFIDIGPLPNWTLKEVNELILGRTRVRSPILKLLIELFVHRICSDPRFQVKSSSVNA